ncbi:MAG: uracil-DNA glycosylase [Acidobacteria bacterium]|nr:uracil-DNA glycosylase [Acidobacteriota bacterium]MBF83895.1 uracil-DNA glycosylase [Acidobacteriota bacterium]MCH2278182.1 uracil-DNA glycosylase [Vicinamibacterales bacterium]
MRSRHDKPTRISLSTIRQAVVHCDRCPRLRAYCARVAGRKKAAHRDDVYWGRPVPGFGDRRARLLVLGLAPAAHGANRTGRVFTGDGSGDFLMRAMHQYGFANIPTARHATDGLKLRDAYITAVVRCAPPDNKPTGQEIKNCQPHLEAELAALPNVHAIIALGRIAYDTYWRVMRGLSICPSPRPAFKHGLVFTPDRGPALIASYHPSRQNTNTGRLTAPMLACIFKTASQLITSAAITKHGRATC